MAQIVREALTLAASYGILRRTFSRWSHRRPIKVYENEVEEFEEIAPRRTRTFKSSKPPKNPDVSTFEWPIKFESKSNTSKPILNPTTFEWPIKFESKSNTSKPTLNPTTPFIEQKTITVPYKKEKILLSSALKDHCNTENEFQRLKIANGEITFKKLKQNDKILSTLMLSIKSRKGREQQDTVLLEGTRLIRDALQAGCKPESILFSRVREVNEIVESLSKYDVKLFRVPYKELQVWSTLTTSPGIIGIFKTPNVTQTLKNVNGLPLTIICDNIRDPGNLGAIIRCTAAAGCQNLLLTKGCVELWDTKVLRSACGGHFRTKIEPNLTWDDIKCRLGSNPALFIADNNLENSSSFDIPGIQYDNVQFGGCVDIALVIGGETTGISEEAYKFAQDVAGAKLHIPLSNNVESLNTGMALGILVFEIKRQLKSFIDHAQLQQTQKR